MHLLKCKAERLFLSNILCCVWGDISYNCFFYDFLFFNGNLRKGKVSLPFRGCYVPEETVNELKKVGVTESQNWQSISCFTTRGEKFKDMWASSHCVLRLDLYLES